MLRLPRDLSGQDVIQVLKEFGFTFVRQKGSHVILKKIQPTGENIGCVVPQHDQLAVGTLKGILKQAKISTVDFIAACKG